MQTITYESRVILISIIKLILIAKGCCWERLWNSLQHIGQKEVPKLVSIWRYHSFKIDPCPFHLSHCLISVSSFRSMLRVVSFSLFAKVSVP